MITLTVVPLRGPLKKKGTLVNLRDESFFTGGGRLSCFLAHRLEKSKYGVYACGLSVIIFCFFVIEEKRKLLSFFLSRGNLLYGKLSFNQC